MTLRDLYKILLEAGIPVGHYETQQEKCPYIIYQEGGSSYKWASGQTVREDTKVGAEHYTTDEFDPSLDVLKVALLKNKIPFTVSSTEFDPTEKVIVSIFNITISREMEVEP